MKKTKLAILMIITGLFISCSGVKFANAPVNKDVPDAFKKRALYPAGVAGYEFQDLVGSIIRIKNTEDPIRIGLIRPNNYQNVVIPITDPNNYYKSRIQKGAEIKGSYLAFAADFKAEQLAELELVDIARAGIAFENDSVFQQIVDKAEKWVTQHPNKDTSIVRLWIKSVVLTRRIYNDFTNVGAKASGQVGDVVGVSTGVYNKSEESIRSVLIAFEAFDIDELVKNAAQKDTVQPFIPKSNERTKEFSEYTGIIKGKIK
ncbi:MAG: hypothetical protein GX660_18995 [Clostridiaceae bacterium]|nr:hypothetical protein [Clostridiaceae bacterium]